jgi:predicted nucleic acid-binding protein
MILPGPQRDAFRSQMDRWQEGGYALCAPALWVYEMTSALSKAAFFGQLGAEDAEEALSVLDDLPIQLVHPDAQQCRDAFTWTRRLNRAAAYDSFYLALAESLGCELWTADQRLCHAIDRPWVRLAGAPS